MENTYLIIVFSTVQGYTVKEKMLEGKKHLVVPVVMMVEGVHHGSRGPLLHKIEDLGKFPAAWNGIPIVIDHPAINGEAVSANSPEILETRCVGRVFNTKVKGKKLKANAWLNEDRLRQVSSDVLANVKASEPVEVSVGVFSDEEEEEGEFNGEQYNAIAKNHRPDHLALLPGGTGACSLEDGCGIRANSNNKKGGKKEMIRTDKLVNVIQSLKEQGYALLDIIDNTSEGLMQRLEAVRRKIDSLDSNDSYHMIHEVYDEYVVYESRLRVGESKIYKQNYSFNSGVVELTGDPVEVHKKVEYIANNKSSKFVRTIKTKEDKSMAEKCTPCVEKKVNALIANNQGFAETDREMLQALSEAQLDKLFVKAEAEAEAEIEVNKEGKKKVVKETVEAVQALSEEDKADLAWAKAQRIAKRTKLTKSIQANTAKDTWSDAELNAMSEVQLEKLAGMVQKEEEVDYSIGNNDLNVNADGVAPMAPAGIEFETTK